MTREIPWAGLSLIYFNHKKTRRLRVFSPLFEEDEIPLTTLFRSYEDMPEIEQIALDMSEGRMLDVGAAFPDAVIRNVAG